MIFITNAFIIYGFEDFDYRGELFLRTQQNELRSDTLLETPNTSFEESQNIGTIDLETNWQVTETLNTTLRADYTSIQTPSEQEDESRLIEGFVQYEAYPQLFLDIGKVTEEWGAGYAFNPINALISNKSPSNPSATREGATMLKIELYFESITATAIIVGVADEQSIDEEFILPDSEDKTRIAFKLDHIIGNFDFSWVHIQGGIEGKSLRDHERGSPLLPQQFGPLYGVAWTTIIGDNLEIHGEYATQVGRDRAIPVQTSSEIFSQDGSLLLPTRSSYQQDNDSEDQSFSKMLLGGQYTFDNDFNFIFEWFHNEQGYTNEEWDQIVEGIRNAQKEEASNSTLFSDSNPFEGFLAQTALGLTRNTFRQNYGFLRLFTNEFGDRYTSESIFVFNLDDSSFLFREKLGKLWGEHWSSSLSWTTFEGDPFSEYGLNPYQSQTALQVSYLF